LAFELAVFDRILAAKQQPPSSPFVKGELKGVKPFFKGELCNADTSALERRIDKMFLP
jgi:hypothetical protein